MKMNAYKGLFAVLMATLLMTFLAQIANAAEVNATEATSSNATEASSPVVVVTPASNETVAAGTSAPTKETAVETTAKPNGVVKSVEQSHFMWIAAGALSMAIIGMKRELFCQ